MNNRSLFLILTILVLSSCTIEPGGYKYNTGTISETPVNMGDFNSEFDDYNSTSPSLGSTSPLCFSSNRNSGGKTFDIIYKLLDVIMDRDEGIIRVAENKSGNLDVYYANSNILNALSTINSTYNELGPYLIPQGTRVKNSGTGFNHIKEFILLYATDESGNLDIKFTQNVSNDVYSKPQNIVYLNSAKDDAYPTLTVDSSAIYFCSNRQGNFDIYKADLKKQNDIISALVDSTSRTVVKDTILSSSSNDKCPYIIRNLMVFTSDRPGGYGGFDLYYSLFENGKWSSPVNFGEKINTQYDEYRPIVIAEIDFTNDFMIFSSNRPGGKGGFDLYYVGIDKIE